MVIAASSAMHSLHSGLLALAVGAAACVAPLAEEEASEAKAAPSVESAHVPDELLQRVVSSGRYVRLVADSEWVVQRGNPLVGNGVYCWFKSGVSVVVEYFDSDEVGLIWSGLDNAEGPGCDPGGSVMNMIPGREADEDVYVLSEATRFTVSRGYFNQLFVNGWLAGASIDGSAVLSDGVRVMGGDEVHASPGAYLVAARGALGVDHETCAASSRFKVLGLASSDEGHGYALLEPLDAPSHDQDYGVPPCVGPLGVQLIWSTLDRLTLTGQP